MWKFRILFAIQCISDPYLTDCSRSDKFLFHTNEKCLSSSSKTFKHRSVELQCHVLVWRSQETRIYRYNNKGPRYNVRITMQILLHTFEISYVFKLQDKHNASFLNLICHLRGHFLFTCKISKNLWNNLEKREKWR